MGYSDEDISKIVRESERQDFFDQCKEKEIKNILKNFTDNYKTVSEIVKVVNSFIVSVSNIFNANIEPFTYDEFCQKMLEEAKKRIDYLDFSLLIMEQDTIDMYSKRLLRKNPAIMQKMNPEQFNEYVEKQIPKWAEKRMTTFKEHNLIEFHRDILKSIVNDKMTEEIKKYNSYRNKVSELVTAIHRPNPNLKTTVTLNYK